ncbi:hypothetical protein [Roseivivax sp. CAU 1761]
MSRKTLKRGSGGRHVQTREWFQAMEAWATLKPDPRALYIELKRRYNGTNNGRIRMAVREAAELLNVHFNTVRSYFADLIDRGLVQETRRGHLGAEGRGIATTWALAELPGADGPRPDLSFSTWSPKRDPGPKSVQACHDGCARTADPHRRAPPGSTKTVPCS